MRTMQQVIDQLRSAKNYDTLEKIYVKIIEQVPRTNFPIRPELAEHICLAGKRRERGKATAGDAQRLP